MSQLCANATCKQISHVLCYCCNKNFCLDHLLTHNTLNNYKSNSLIDQINRLHKQLKRLNIDKIVDESRLKLDKWRDNSLKKVHHFYDTKCEELDRYYTGKVRQQQKEIEQLYKKLNELNQKQDTIDENNINELQTNILHLKHKIDKIEQKIIPINIRALTIDNDLIIIGEMKIKGFDLTTLSLPYQTFNISENFELGLASNNQYLLIDQNSDLILFDKDLTIIQQSTWDYGVIHDFCWSSGLVSFIVITEQSKAFLVSGNNLSINSIEGIDNHLWISCTCSNSFLYLTTLSNSIVEFSLLPSFSCMRRWDPPTTCKENEFIKDINCNDDKIALIIVHFSDKIIHLIVRSLTTFDQLFSIRLDIKHLSYQLPIRCCPLKNNEWLVIEANTSQFFHIGKDGKLKRTLTYDQPPYNALLFGSNILVIRTDSTINFHEVLH
ncbi:unnamed protein product [Rotaria sordida]|uniref:B box-type domain-containing protein n=1 Tax=Rotaria sordida TaxID=392033 RepID=A0A813XJ29_9BILA|nr:unnamed protein product [Rotaria sordida]CAF0870682.1 unnamed protein product [Rotaria sordida]